MAQHSTLLNIKTGMTTNPLRPLIEHLNDMLDAAADQYDTGDKGAFSHAIDYVDNGFFLTVYPHGFSAEYKKAQEERVRYSITISKRSEASPYVIEERLVDPDTNYGFNLPDAHYDTLESAVIGIFKAFTFINKDFTEQKYLELNPWARGARARWMAKKQLQGDSTGDF